MKGQETQYKMGEKSRFRAFITDRVHLKRLLLAFGLLAYFLIMTWGLTATGIGCVFLYLFGIECPGCGMTRALKCLLQLDLAGAFRYNPLIFCMPYVFSYIIFDFKGRIHKYILLGIGAAAVINWVLNAFVH